MDAKRWDDLAALLVEEPKLRFFDTEGSLLYEFDTTEKWIALMSDYLKGARLAYAMACLLYTSDAADE